VRWRKTGTEDIPAEFGVNHPGARFTANGLEIHLASRP
jgi:hypothetical protein